MLLLVKCLELFVGWFLCCFFFLNSFTSNISSIKLSVVSCYSKNIHFSFEWKFNINQHQPYQQVRCFMWISISPSSMLSCLCCWMKTLLNWIWIEFCVGSSCCCKTCSTWWKLHNSWQIQANVHRNSFANEHKRRQVSFDDEKYSRVFNFYSIKEKKFNLDPFFLESLKNINSHSY